MSDLFAWWTGGVSLAVVIFLCMCAGGTAIAVALTKDEHTDEEQAHDDNEQAKAVRKVSSANYWS